MKYWNAMNLGTRLACAFGLLLLLLLGMALLSAREIGVVNGTLRYYSANTTPSLQAVRLWQDKLANIRMLQAQHLMTVTDDEMKALETRIDQQYSELSSALAAHEKLLANAQDREQWQAVRELAAQTMAHWDKLKAVSRASLADPERTEEARRLFTGRSQRLFESSAVAIDKEWALKSDTANSLAEDGAKTYRVALALLAAACALALATGALTAVLVVRSIGRQMGGEPSAVARIALAIAEGDLSVRVPTRAHDDSSVMAAMATMRERLATVVAEVRQGSESIAAGSAEIASGNLDLSQRTENQASDLQQTVTSVGQLSSAVQLNAQTADHANQLAMRASSAATEGGKAVAQVVATMQGIAASSKTINDITGVIDGIAFQTNILALNAAVEAARAGEQGRGFAVVASEVRMLAHRSAEAAKEIKKLIADNVDKVQSGARQVNDAGQAIAQIVDQVQHVSQLIHDIHSASAQQNQGIAEVSHAVDRIDQVTHQNAALVEQSSAAAESLRLQASRLAEVVGIFRLQAPALAAPDF